MNSATPIYREHAANAGVRNFALLFLGCLAFHLAGTWSLPLIDRDEPRFAEASREMRERSNYVVPYFNDQYRFDKPPLTYWAQIASYHLLGENDFAARLPTGIAAAVVALLLFAWGRRIANERVGLWAAMIFTLCLQSFIHGKAAVADMWLVLFVTSAHWAGYELLLGEKRDKRPTPNVKLPTPNAERFDGKFWWWVFYVSLAFAFLAKGPIGWTPLLAIAATRFFIRDGQPYRRFAFVSGGALMLAIVAAWGVPALFRTHGEFFSIGIGRHVVARSLVAMEGHGANSPGAYLLTLPFFFVAVFLSFFPWSIKLPWLTRRLWHDRDATDNYLIVCAAVIFVIFTLVKTKLLHYTLPAFPLLSLLLARHLVVSRSRFFKPAAIITGTACLAAALILFPLSRPFFPSVQLHQKSRANLRPEMEFAGVEYIEPSLVWYFRGSVHGWFTKLDPPSVKIFMDTPGARFVVLPTKTAQVLYPTLPRTWKSYRTAGWNFVKGRRIDLTMILKPRQS